MSHAIFTRLTDRPQTTPSSSGVRVPATGRRLVQQGGGSIRLRRRCAFLAPPYRPMLALLLVGVLLVACTSAHQGVTPTPTSSATPPACHTWRPLTSPSTGSIPIALSGLAALSSTDVWAVGSSSQGMLSEHWDGTSWHLISVPAVGSGAILSGIAAVSAHDLWAVGSFTAANGIVQPLIEHGDGTRWQPVPDPDPHTPRSGIASRWLTGDIDLNPHAPRSGTAGQWLTGVAALSATDAWAVGYSAPAGTSTSGTRQPLIEHWDGSQWQMVPAPATGTTLSALMSVTALAPTTAWAVGQSNGQPLIEHWDGVRWSGVVGPAGSGSLLAVAADAANDVWAVGTSYGPVLVEHYDGTRWSVVPAPDAGAAVKSSLAGVTVLSRDDAWAVGQGGGRGLIEHWDGARWNLVAGQSVGGFGFLSAVVALSPADVWSVGDNLTAHWNGAQWQIIPGAQIGVALGELTSITALSATDAWAVGDTPTAGGSQEALIEHWDGRRWQLVPAPAVGDASSALSGVAAFSQHDAWAVGSVSLPNQPTQTLIVQWDGTRWQAVSSLSPGSASNQLTAVAALSPSDVWAVGGETNLDGTAQGLIEHWDGTHWQVVASSNPGSERTSFAGIAAISATDVWVVGQTSAQNGGLQALMEHWDGTRWHLVSGPASSWLAGIAAVSATDVWAVGLQTGPLQPLIEHWNGVRWQPVPAPGRDSSLHGILQGVTARSATDVWAVGQFFNAGRHALQPLIVHWDGTHWQVEPGLAADVSGGLRGIATSAAGLWAVGQASQANGPGQVLIAQC